MTDRNRIIYCDKFPVFKKFALSNFKGLPTTEKIVWAYPQKDLMFSVDNYLHVTKIEQTSWGIQKHLRFATTLSCFRLHGASTPIFRFRTKDVYDDPHQPDIDVFSSIIQQFDLKSITIDTPRRSSRIIVLIKDRYTGYELRQFILDNTVCFGRAIIIKNKTYPFLYNDDREIPVKLEWGEIE